MSWGAGLVNGIAIGIDVSLSDKNNADRKPVIKPTAPANLVSTGWGAGAIARFQMNASTISVGSVAKYVGKDSLGKTADLTVSGTTSLSFNYDLGKPSQIFTFNAYAVSDKGVYSDASNTVNLTTYPNAATILSASYPALNSLKLTWKNNPNNGNAPITRWQIRLDNSTGNRVFDVTATESAGIYTATLVDVPAVYCGAGISAYVIAWNASGNSSINGSSAYPVVIPVPVAPGKVDVTAAAPVSDTSISITVTKPTGTDPMTYSVPVVQTNPSKAFTEQVVFTWNGNVGTGTVEGLDPGAGVTVGCYATNAAGQGSNSGATKTVTMPDHSIPVAPTLDAVFPAATSVVLAYTYTDNRPGGGIEPMFYTGYASDGVNTFKREVYDPDQDLLVPGLTVGKTYDCWVTATSIQGKEGPKSNVMQATTATQIPAPVVKSITAGDGVATAIFDSVTPDPKFTVAHYSFIAENKNNPDSPEVEGYCVSGTPFALPNDITWSVRICAVCNPGLVPGDLSAATEVSPEKPIAPFKPTITSASCDDAGIISVAWVKGTSVNGSRQSGSTVDQWKISFKCINDKGTDFQLTADGGVTNVKTDKVNLGSIWEITVTGHNSVGWGNSSNPVSVSYNPSVKDPLVGGTAWDDGVYKYCLFYSNATTGYEALRTDAGTTTEFEVLMVGAGGAGKGQTVTFGKGGDGGGGQLVMATLPPAAAGSIFVTVPSGGTTSTGNPANTTVKEGSLVLTAIAGKSATDKNNAEGYPKQKVPAGWDKLNMFTWLLPGSAEVGGTAVSGEQNFPNATFCGEGGAGTKDNRGGNAQPSYVAIRWKK